MMAIWAAWNATARRAYHPALKHQTGLLLFWLIFKEFRHSIVLLESKCQLKWSPGEGWRRIVGWDQRTKAPLAGDQCGPHPEILHFLWDRLWTLGQWTGRPHPEVRWLIFKGSPCFKISCLTPTKSGYNETPPGLNQYFEGKSPKWRSINDDKSLP